MKKLLVVMLVLAMAGMANAAMELTLSGTTVAVGSDITIDVSAPVEIGQSSYMLGVITGSIGDGSFDVTNAIVVYLGVPSSVYLDSEFAGDLGLRNNYARMDLSDNVGSIDPVVGSLVTGIKFHGVTAGSVTLRVFDGNGGQQGDDYVITVGSSIPEPITIGLLGLGGLFLRRRK